MVERLKIEQRDSPVRAMVPPNIIEGRIHELKAAGILGIGPYRTATVGAYYDRVAAAIYAPTYMNFGLWNNMTATHDQASESLITTLVTRITNRDGNVLDVGCGSGGSTRFLTRYWSSNQVIGINITTKQVDICRRRIPECRFLVMDATCLAFDDESFDNIVCVEAAMHFQTREQFLREALRVLKPGGTLAMSDLLLHKEALSLSGLFPPENYLDSPMAYRDLLTAVGFAEAKIQDITDSGWRSYARYHVRRANDEWFSGDITFKQLQNQLSYVYSGIAVFSSNLLVVARK